MEHLKAHVKSKHSADEETQPLPTPSSTSHKSKAIRVLIKIYCKVRPSRCYNFEETLGKPDGNLKRFVDDDSFPLTSAVDFPPLCCGSGAAGSQIILQEPELHQNVPVFLKFGTTVPPVPYTGKPKE
jgi:hypothetical protein